MSVTNSELVWRGQVHLGDEPGIFGLAHYGGLRVELPVTLRADGTAATTTLVLGTDNVTTMSPAPGHPVTIVVYEPGQVGEAYVGTELAAGRLTTSDADFEIIVDLSGRTSPFFVGVRVEVDTTIAPGLYDDFLLTSLANRSEGAEVTAAFGFSR